MKRVSRPTEEVHSRSLPCKHHDRRAKIAIAVALALGALTACSASNPILSSGPEPRVEDCMLLQQATPTRYICNGKAYTAVQLADIRRGKSSDSN